jgi:hypothetical protein
VNNSNPFRTPLPVTVYLRSCQLAVVERANGASGFPLVGRLKGEGAMPECWRADGRWCESGKKHPLDIIGEITGTDAASGALIMEPYAPAAGVKGAQP